MQASLHLIAKDIPALEHELECFSAMPPRCRHLSLDSLRPPELYSFDGDLPLPNRVPSAMALYPQTCFNDLPHH